MVTGGLGATLIPAALGLATAESARDASDWTGAHGGLTFGVASTDGGARRGDVVGQILEIDAANGLFPGPIDAGEPSVIGGLAIDYGVGRQARPSWAGWRRTSRPRTSTGRSGSCGWTRRSSSARGRTRPTPPRSTPRPPCACAAGCAIGDTLPYAPGGLAAGRIAGDFSIAIPAVGFETASFRQDDMLVGHTLGAGLERRLGGGMPLSAARQTG